MPNKVALVGHCGADASYLKIALKKALKEAEIISIDQAERKIGLSMKAANRSAELAEAQGYSGSAPGATLGDVFRNKLKGLQKTDTE